MEPMRIEAYPLQFIIYPRNQQDIELIRLWCRNFIRVNTYWDKRRKQKVTIPVAAYVFFSKDRSNIRAMRTMLPDFIAHLNLARKVEGKDFIIEEKSLDIKLVENKYPEVLDHIKPRGEQGDLIEFITKNHNGCYLMALFTGGGKSLSSIMICQKLKQRMVCIMRPGYHGEQTEDSISGWIKEFSKSTKVDPKDICTVSGNKELKSIINLALAGELHYKVILISNKTLQYYVKYYEDYSEEEFKDLGFNATPMELGKVLGVDIVFVDEVHQDSHFQCKLITYLGVNKMVGATGTIKASDPFVNKMAAYAYPVKNRYMQKNIEPHVQPTAFHFKFDKPFMIRSDGFRGYNHINFEKSILKRKGLTRQYFGMIDNLVYDRFLTRLPLDPEYKCLIVVASINMARALAAYLKECYPELEVNSFVEDDPDSNAFNSTICVSTHQSSGTGLDIPKLAAVFMTVAIGSEQTNIQVQGRLRKLPTEGALHDFVYFVCDDIDSHRKYHYDKRDRIFKGKLLPVIELDSGIVLEV